MADPINASSEVETGIHPDDLQISCRRIWSAFVSSDPPILRSSDETFDLIIDNQYTHDIQIAARP